MTESWRWSFHWILVLNRCELILNWILPCHGDCWWSKSRVRLYPACPEYLRSIGNDAIIVWIETCLLWFDLNWWIVKFWGSLTDCLYMNNASFRITFWWWSSITKCVLLSPLWIFSRWRWSLIFMRSSCIILIVLLLRQEFIHVNSCSWRTIASIERVPYPRITF